MTTTIFATILIIYLLISIYGTYQIGKELEGEKQIFKEDFKANAKTLFSLGFVLGIIYLIEKITAKNFIILLILIKINNVVFNNGK